MKGKPDGEPAVRGVADKGVAATETGDAAPPAPASLNVSLCFFWPLSSGHIL